MKTINKAILSISLLASFAGVCAMNNNRPINTQYMQKILLNTKPTLNAQHQSLLTPQALKIVYALQLIGLGRHINPQYVLQSNTVQNFLREHHVVTRNFIRLHTLNTGRFIMHIFNYGKKLTKEQIAQLKKEEKNLKLMSLAMQEITNLNMTGESLYLQNASESIINLTPALLFNNTNKNQE